MGNTLGFGTLTTASRVSNYGQPAKLYQGSAVQKITAGTIDFNNDPAATTRISQQATDKAAKDSANLQTLARTQQIRGSFTNMSGSTAAALAQFTQQSYMPSGVGTGAKLRQGVRDALSNGTTPDSAYAQVAGGEADQAAAIAA